MFIDRIVMNDVSVNAPNKVIFEFEETTTSEGVNLWLTIKYRVAHNQTEHLGRLQVGKLVTDTLLDMNNAPKYNRAIGFGDGYKLELAYRSGVGKVLEISHEVEDDATHDIISKHSYAVKVPDKRLTEVLEYCEYLLSINP